MNPVLLTTKFVVDRARNVIINHDKIADFCQTFSHMQSHFDHWLDHFPVPFPKLDDEETLNFLLFFNAMSFCYWGEPKWTVVYRNQSFDGAWAMVACMRRALDEGKHILSPEYLASMKKDEFEHILRGNIQIPLFDERLTIIKHVGAVLAHDYSGRFSNLVREADGDALKLIHLIVKQFSSFDDASIYAGKAVYFFKRAQLLASDIHRKFKGNGIGAFKNSDELTACADYKLPQLLRRLGIFEYTPALATKIDNKIQLPKDSPDEVEIRACTIRAVELMKQRLLPKFPHITSMEIDDYLWLAGQEKSPTDKPYHLTRTTAY